MGMDQGVNNLPHESQFHDHGESGGWTPIAEHGEKRDESTWGIPRHHVPVKDPVYWHRRDITPINILKIHVRQSWIGKKLLIELPLYRCGVHSDRMTSVVRIGYISDVPLQEGTSGYLTLWIKTFLRIYAKK